MDALDVVLEDSKKLIVSLDQIGESITAPGAPPELHLDLRQAREAARNITRYLHANARAQRAAARQDVFSTPELLELVLSFLDRRTLAGTLQVSRGFASVIKQSVRLQQRLFLKGDRAAHFELIEHCRWTYDIAVVKSSEDALAPVAPEHTLVLNLIPAGQRSVSRFLRFSGYSRSALICQPPAFDATISTACRCIDGGISPPHSRARVSITESIASSTGLTVMAAIAAAQKVHESGRLCLINEPSRAAGHDSLGAVTFRAPIMLQDDDPDRPRGSSSAQRKAWSASGLPPAQAQRDTIRVSVREHDDAVNAVMGALRDRLQSMALGNALPTGSTAG